MATPLDPNHKVPYAAHSGAAAPAGTAKPAGNKEVELMNAKIKETQDKVKSADPKEAKNLGQKRIYKSDETAKQMLALLYQTLSPEEIAQTEKELEDFEKNLD